MSQMRWRCNDKGCYLDIRSDPVMFDGCFPGRITMGDIDGIVELNGHFLVVEYKTPGAAASRGQEIMFERLAALGKFTVIEVQAFRSDVEGWRIIHEGRTTWERWHGGLEELRDFVRNWAANLDSRPIFTAQRVAVR